MNAPSIDIKDLLEAETELGLTFGESMFIGKEPADPDEAVTLFDTYGGPPETTLGADGGYYYPAIQIRVRSKNYEEGWNTIQGILLLLHNRGQEVINGTLYSAIICTSGPAFLEWDDNNRVKFIINFETQRREN